MNSSRPYSWIRQTAPALTASHYLTLIDTTRDFATYSAAGAAALPTTPGPLQKGLMAGGRIVGHIYSEGQDVTLGARILRADGAWASISDFPATTVTAGVTHGISFLYSNWGADFLLFAQAGGTPPTSLHYELTILWDRSAGV